jgi:hypothetical protein
LLRRSLMAKAGSRWSWSGLEKSLRSLTTC